MKARRQELILGILTFDFGTGEFRNSLLTVGAGTGVYHKRHLVPFGEYFPVPEFIRERIAPDESPLHGHHARPGWPAAAHGARRRAGAEHLLRGRLWR